MKKQLLFLLALPLWSQMTLVLPANAVQGSTVDGSSMASDSSGAGRQAILQLPSTITSPPVITAGTAAVAAQKQIACNAANLCMVYGLNTLTMAPGEWMHFKFNVPSTLTGNIQVCLSAPVEGDPAGNGIPVTVGPCVAVSISPSVSPCDINGDGRIDAADVTLAVQRTLAIPQVAMDLNKDGATNVDDVLIIIYAQQGFGCRAL